MPRKTYIDEKGYRRFKDTNRLVHRWVAGKKYGEKRIKGKVIHHKDGNKLNNRPNNLALMERSRHSKHHYTGPKYHYRGRKRKNGIFGLFGLIFKVFSGCVLFVTMLTTGSIKFIIRLIRRIL